MTPKQLPARASRSVLVFLSAAAIACSNSTAGGASPVGVAHDGKQDSALVVDAPDLGSAAGEDTKSELPPSDTPAKSDPETVPAADVAADAETTAAPDLAQPAGPELPGAEVADAAQQPDAVPPTADAPTVDVALPPDAVADAGADWGEADGQAELALQSDAVQDGALQEDALEDSVVQPDAAVADSMPSETLAKDDSAPEISAQDGVSPDAPSPDASDAPVALPCPSTCDDGDPCTADLCPPGSGVCENTLLDGCFYPAAPCTSDSDCGNPTPWCKLPANTCVACLKSSDCGTGYLCQGFVCIKMAACKSDKDCKATGQVCSKADAVCVDCNLNADCPAAMVCSAHKCAKPQPCTTSKECAGVCNATTGLCAQCATADDCEPTQQCNGGACVAKACLTGACGSQGWFACLADGSGYAKPAACDDNNVCTVGDSCKAGGCKPGAAKLCDDGNPCTSDSCDSAKGCTAQPNQAPCDDNNPCTFGDICGASTCTGKPQDCNDGNNCTDDFCVAGTCGAKPNNALCNDGNACTVGDACANGSCGAGKSAVCDDKNVCTTDSCQPAAGCAFAPTTTTCDDGNLCTSGDTCATGACKGAPVNCDDGNNCTADTCNGGQCEHADASGPCGNGGPCAACSGGTCKDNAGTGLWTKYFGTETANETVYAIAAASDGGGFAAGPTSGAAVAGFVARFGADGAPLWQKPVTGNGQSWFTGAAVAASDWYAVGNTTSATGAERGWVIRFAEDGKEHWNKVYGVAASNRLWDAVGVGNTMVAVGGAGTLAWSLHLDAQGNIVTEKSWAGLAVFNDIAARPDGSLVAAGFTSAGTDDAVVAAWALDGKVLWQTAVSLLGTQGLSSIDVDPTGAVVALGMDTFSGPMVMRFAANGTYLGKQTVPLGGGEVLNAVLALAGGDIVLAGATSTSVATDGLLLRVDPKGNAIWKKVISTPGEDSYFTLQGTDTGLFLTGGRGKPAGFASHDGRVQRVSAIGQSSCTCTSNSDCDDSNPCTVDACANNGDCLHVPAPGCVFATLPAAENFACGGLPAGWQIQGPKAPAPVWAVDNTPELPGAATACTLNFNNGKDFSCPAGTNAIASSFAISPLYAGSSLPAKSAVMVSFEIAGGWQVGAGDNLTLEWSADDATWTEIGNYDPPPLGAVKVVNQLITGAGGANFRLRLRFWTVDCTDNDLPGPFVAKWTVQQGTCKDAAVCDDGNPCTNDSCDLAGGCAHTAIAAACSDGNACTLLDACKAGKCVGVPKACDDGDQCTQDGCADGLCTHVAAALACNDGNACTTGDTCANGICFGLFTKNCDDLNACTDDICNPAIGCKSINNAAPCDDLDLCTTNDACQFGVCAGVAISCDDGNLCTADACVGGLCKNVALADKTSCGFGAYCLAGNCQLAKCGNGTCEPSETSQNCVADCPLPAGHPCDGSCGAKNATFGCYCDAACKNYGDCCTASGAKAKLCAGSTCLLCQ